jgi:hypothetical protein
MKRFVLSGLVAAMLIGTGTVALADQPSATTFVFVLSAAEEVPACVPATNAARGVATFHVTDAATGTVEYKVVANNLPGTVTAAHIHIGPPGVAVPGNIVQALEAVVPGPDNGVVGRGTFTNPTLVAQMLANPHNYYVNVHSNICPSGVIRGQLDDHGPLNN